MGKVFEMDWEPTFGKELQLTNFSQLLTTSSGRVEVRSGLAMSMFQFQMLKNDEEEELESQVHCWEPTQRLLVPTICLHIIICITQDDGENIRAVSSSD